MMNEPPAFDPERHLEAMAPLMGLTITQEQKPAVLQFLALAAGMARIVSACPLEEAEFSLAPVFRPEQAGGDSA